jgi:D-glycero-alpha-D-manno-heptose-7-phosphate kinase
MPTFDVSLRAPKVRARAPLRLGLGGGGTDVSPYCDRFGGVVLNATIDLYAYATVAPLDGDRVVLAAGDQDVRLDFPAAPAVPTDRGLPLHCGVYNRVVAQFRGGEPLPIRVTTRSDAPAGSGLGASSTLVVAMVRAYVEFLNLPLTEYDIARLAYEIEREDLQLAGGRQDQYAAAFGGVNFMEFYAGERVVVNPLRIKSWVLSELESSTVLYYTGVSRESARIIVEQRERMERLEPDAIAALDALKDEAWAMKECILRGNIRGFADSMIKGWDAKKRTASNITTADIDRAIEGAMRSGAYSAKVSGAGGGGFVVFFVDPDRRIEVVRALQASGKGAVHPCHFTEHGTHGWRIP